jgi:hypothetical protein
MTTKVSAYTHLESLLLFQCLHAYGVAPSVFGKISDLLKNTPDVTGHKFFQAGRLSPDALRNFYLERLRKEIDHEQGTDSEGQNGDVKSSSKRKRHSPSLPTVQESLQHQHLIPMLVTKLYASYRKEVAKLIRDDEERYFKLEREIQSIERGEWDDQLRERAATKSASRSPTVPRRISPQLAQKPLQPSTSPPLGQNGAQGGPVTAPSPDPSQTSAPEATRTGLRSPSARKKQPLAVDQRPASSTPQTPAATAPTQQVSVGRLVKLILFDCRFLIVLNTPRYTSCVD